MKKILLFCCMVFAFSLLHAEKMADYPDIWRPVRIHIEGDSMYVGGYFPGLYTALIYLFLSPIFIKRIVENTPFTAHHIVK